MTNITKGDFIHKAGLGFDWWDTVEILIPIETERKGPVYGTVVSIPDLNFPEDEVNDILVIVGSDLYEFGPRDIVKVMDRTINVESAEIQDK